ncbi:hypothetical protein V1523DRAFT_222404 [Lipomyces doorenjongii]
MPATSYVLNRPITLLVGLGLLQIRIFAVIGIILIRHLQVPTAANNLLRILGKPADNLFVFETALIIYLTFLGFRAFYVGLSCAST